MLVTLSTPLPEATSPMRGTYVHVYMLEVWEVHAGGVGGTCVHAGGVGGTCVHAGGVGGTCVHAGGVGGTCWKCK